MNSQEKRLIVGVCVVMAAATVSAATFNFLVLPMINDLDASEPQQSLLRQMPSIGALLVIFLAGVLGPRIGPRRFVVYCGLVMAVGYLCVLVSTGMAMASIGMLLGSIGQQGLFVVVLGVLSARLVTRDSRASGFAAVAAVNPLVYLVAPIVAALLVGATSWRFVIGFWMVAALAGTLCAARLLPADDQERGERGELWTPALAGFALAGIVQSINSLNAVGLSAPSTVGWLCASVFAFLTLIFLMRRLPKPSLDITVLRHGGFRLLLVAVMLVPLAGLTYYAMIGMQLVYGQDVIHLALLMIPVEITSLAGAWLSGRMIRRWGIRITGTTAMLATAATLFLAATQTVTEPLALALAVLCLYTGAKNATNAPITNAIMNLASKGGEGSASAFRGAAGSLGNAVGVAIMSTVVFSTFQSSLTAELLASGGDVSQAASIAESLRSGVSSEQAASQYSVPLTEVETISSEQKQAMVDAYRMEGIVGGVVLLLAAGIFVLLREDERPRWRRAAPVEASRSTTPSGVEAGEAQQ